MEYKTKINATMNKIFLIICVTLIESIVCISVQSQTHSKEYLDNIFAREKPLVEIAQTQTNRYVLDAQRPNVTSASSLTTRSCIWGPADNITISMLKTDVIDRRYVDKDHYTMNDIIEGAYSEANKDLNDMPMAGMTRPSFFSLDKRGGRYNHGLWSEVYPFPCQKPVGQVIIKVPDFKGKPQPEAVQQLKSGEINIHMSDGDKRLDLGYLLSMENNVTAIDLDYENLDSLITFRLYHDLDQGHRRYMEEDGSFKKVVVFEPADANKPLEYYDFTADLDVNGKFEPPTYGKDGRFFWVHQIFPAEKTFPQGFRFVLMAMVSNADYSYTEHSLQKNLGTRPYIPRDNQGFLMVPGIRTTTHPEMVELQALNYSYVADAPGVAIDATLKMKNKKKGKARLYIAIATLNETKDYMQRAKDILLDAEKRDMIS